MIVRQQFADGEALAQNLAEAVAARLGEGIARKGAAALAVSGGTTPKRFFARLAAQDELDWSKVQITLVDERWVDESAERSNARLVNTHLRVGPAAKASFIPLYSGGEEPTYEALALTNARLAQMPQSFDAVVLGMGTDGHTASFFPGADNLDAALHKDGPTMAITAPGAAEPRVTLTLPKLLRTEALFLHIEGAAKAETLERALAEGPIEEMPVRAVLRQTERRLEIYWCP